MRCTLCDLREEFWRRNGYTSQNCPLEGSSEEEEEEGEEEEEEEEEERQINYVVGDVTKPQNTGSSDAIIIHCVGECSLVLFTHDRFKPNCERSSHYSWVGGCIGTMWITVYTEPFYVNSIVAPNWCIKVCVESVTVLCRWLWEVG